MNIELISQDIELYTLCREILAEICGPRCPWTLSTVAPEHASRDADLQIWDCPPNFPIGEYTDTRASRSLFLVSRKELANFRHARSTAEANILLKPVTRATLFAFLDLALSRDAANSLRADRDEILQCLIQTNLKLQEYDQDRTNFLARAVHDFRAPLTALNGYCGLLLSQPFGALDEDQKEILRRMQNSAKRLSRMAAAMFELSVGRHVSRAPDLRRGDIGECVDQALHEVAPMALDKSISITSNLEMADEALYFEPGQIEQVLINILDNACKFTPRAGAIEIRGYPFFWERRGGESPRRFTTDRRRTAVCAPNSYRVDISDSGAAIPVEHLPRIFEEYTSYCGGSDRSGGGLGLAICRMIITQHNGRVWAENTRSGPRFSFALPIHRSECSSSRKEHRLQADDLGGVHFHAH
jgi:signal transduction histidine kinase